MARTRCGLSARRPLIQLGELVPLDRVQLMLFGQAPCLIHVAHDKGFNLPMVYVREAMGDLDPVVQERLVIGHPHDGLVKGRINLEERRPVLAH